MLGIDYRRYYERYYETYFEAYYETYCETSRRLRSVKISSAQPACLKKTSVPEKNKRVTNIYGCA